MVPIPAGIMQGLFPSTQMQTTSAPFQWGSGGRRMTPEDIARERKVAASLMQSDYSPVQHWTQGLGRVADNVLGAFRERDTDRAVADNQAYSRSVADLLSNPGGTPSASGPPGVASQSSAPGGNQAALLQALSDPYLDPSVKAIAQMQLEQQQKMAMKQFEYANREQPEIVRLANLANDPTQPEHVRKAAQARVNILNDPMAIIPGLPIGTYVGPQSGVAAALGGGGGGGPRAGDVVDGYRFLGGDPNNQQNWQSEGGPPPISSAPSRVSQKDADAAMAKARAEGDEWMRRNMTGGR